MIKHTVNYTDFNGEEVTEDLYFHLSIPEIAKLEAKFGSELVAHAKKLGENQDAQGMIDFLEDMVLGSYGVKSADGRSFIKDPEVRKEFEYSQAYAELFKQLILDQEFGQRFGEGLVSGAKKK